MPDATTARAAGAADSAPTHPHTDVVRRTRRTEAVVVVVALVALGLTAAVVFLDVRAAGQVFPAGVSTEPSWVTAVCGMLLLVPGVFILRGHPDHRLGKVLLVAGSAWVLDALAGAWLLEALAHGRPLGGLAYVVVNRWGAFLLLTLPLVLLLFPDGHLPHGRVWRALSITSLIASALLPVCLVFAPTSVLDARFGSTTDTVVAALGIDALSVASPAWPVLLDVAYGAVPVSLVIPLAVVVHRYRAARGLQRLQMRWLVWAGLVGLVVMLLANSLPAWASNFGFLLAIGLTSSAIMIAVLRYRLYGIDRLLPTTLVAVALALLVLAVDGVVLAVAGAAFGDRDSALIAVAVVAVLYTPLRSRLWRAARRLTRGSRDDPYAAVSTLAGRLETAAAPGEQLAALARSVAEAFKLPYVRVEIDRADGARAVVEHGHTDSPTVELPIRYRDESIGRVVVAEGRRLSESDQRLLGDLLRQAAGAARAGALSASLQSAREGLVTAREEERRRLRRDLHDSLGPGLGAVTLRIETARGLAARDPERADAVLEQAVADVGALLTDVRRLVHDLRPPALDELGLLGALRAQARRLSTEELAVSVDGEPGELADLTAACEVAAFRIASEALTNVVRHAAATQARVTLDREGDRLVVTVADDGRGIGADVVAGVGTLSLRERAAELGGRTTVTCPPGGGTVVTAELPCATTTEEGDA